MKTIIHSHALYVDDKELPLISGEIHYWRHASHYWDTLLDRVTELGLPLVSTYVCWDFHETAPGTFDFGSGNIPERDLPAFLEKARDHGLYVILRPGPYIYAEWKNLGIPDRVVSLPRLSNEFVAEAAQYLAALIEITRPWFATNGGPIVLWQADNEIDCMPHLYTTPLGLSHAAGDFQSFIARRYTSINELNHAWGTSYSSFAEAHPYTFYQPAPPAAHVRYSDWMAFRHEYNTRVAARMIELLVSLGVDLPLYLNSYPHQDSIDFKSFTERADLFGIDPYPSGNFQAEPDEFQRFIEKVAVLNAVAGTAYIAEFESGIWEGQQEYTSLLPPNHYRLMCTAAIAAGCKGWNWYMLAERDNWLYAPISNRGSVRNPLFSVFKDIVSVFHQMRPARLSRITDCAVTFDLMQNALRAVPRDDQARRALFSANIPYEFRDWRSGCVNTPLLFYSGPHWLCRAGQDSLYDYVNRGGTLVCFQTWPVTDDSLKPYCRLPIPEPDGILPCISAEIISGDSPIPVQSVLYWWQTVEGEALQAVRTSPPPTHDYTALHEKLEQGDTWTIGFIRPIGSGRLVVLGCEPTAALMRNLCSRLGYPPAVSTDIPGISTVLLRDNDRGDAFVAIMNHSSSFHICTISISLQAAKCMALFDKKELAAVSSDGLTMIRVPLEPFSAEIVQLLV